MNTTKKIMNNKKEKEQIELELKHLERLKCRYIYDYCESEYCVCQKKNKLNNILEQFKK